MCIIVKLVQRSRSQSRTGLIFIIAVTVIVIIMSILAVHVYVDSVLLYFGFLCVALIDFAVDFCFRTSASDCLEDHLRNNL